MKRAAWMILLVAPLIGCPSSGQDTADSTGDNGAGAPVGPPFSADTAYAYLKKQVAFGPRVSGTPGHAAQLAWMKEFLAARADAVEQQNFTHTHTQTQKPLRMSNLFARFNASAPQRVLLVAHWDTRPTADQDDDQNRDQPIPGANDGASGVAVLLEIANVLKKNPPPIGVDLLLVDGEDYGPDSDDMYLGAKHFAQTMTMYKPLYGILVDMVADHNPVFPIEGNSKDAAPEVIERVWRLAEQLGYGNHFVRRDGGYITDDHIPLNSAGIRTIDIIDFDYPHWHRVTDSVENTSPRGLEVVGKVLVELIYRGG